MHSMERVRRYRTGQICTICPKGCVPPASKGLFLVAGGVDTGGENFCPEGSVPQREPSPTGRLWGCPPPSNHRCSNSVGQVRYVQFAPRAVCLLPPRVCFLWRLVLTPAEKTISPRAVCLLPPWGCSLWHLGPGPESLIRPT